MSSDSLPTRLTDLRWLAAEEVRRLFAPRLVLDEGLRFEIVKRGGSTARLAVECSVSEPFDFPLSKSERERLQGLRPEPDGTVRI